MSTTTPEKLNDRATWYLASNLPHPNAELAKESEFASADLVEIALCRPQDVGEQSYKQVEHVPG